MKGKRRETPDGVSPTSIAIPGSFLMIQRDEEARAFVEERLLAVWTGERFPWGAPVRSRSGWAVRCSATPPRAATSPRCATVRDKGDAKSGRNQSGCTFRKSRRESARCPHRSIPRSSKQGWLASLPSARQGGENGCLESLTEGAGRESH